MGFRSSSVKRRLDCPLTVLVWVDSVVVTGFIQRRRCLVLLWRWRGYELVFWGGLCQIMSFLIWFLLLFFFVYVIDVCFCFVSCRWRCVVALFRLCELVWKSWIWLFFLDWRSRFFSFAVVMLDAYLHSTWLVLSWCFS